MADYGSNVYTLADIKNLKDPLGSVADVAEILDQDNEMLSSAPLIEGNLDTGNRSTIRTSLPRGSLRRVNQGTVSSKGTTAQVDDKIGIYEDFSVLDVDMPAGGDANLAGIRQVESRAHIEGLGQMVSESIIYGSELDDDREPNGLAYRFASASASAAYADSMLNGGAASGQTDCTSIWLIVFGPGRVWLTYPRGTTAGLKHEYLGRQLIQQSTDLGGALLPAHVDRFQMKVGPVTKDWRCVARIHSIDVGNLVAESSAADLIKLMVRATHRVKRPAKGAVGAFFTTRTVQEMLHIQALAKASAQLRVDNVDGMPVVSIGGYRVLTCDQILHTETSLN